MSAALFFHAPCPSCGATVELASSASAFAVCGYCRSGLSLQDKSLSLIGEAGQVLEDYSPLQIGSAGRWEGTRFTVIGRIQLTYPGGYWNEWRVLFDTGHAGWLADASGQYSMLRPHESALTLPAFPSLRAGQPFSLFGYRFTVVDHREARCTGAQGELPFALTARWTARVVDLRNHEAMATLDYSGTEPAVYFGKPVRLEELDMQLLRDPATIAQSAGRIKGKLEPLKCPACGADVDTINGVTPRAACLSCGSVLDTSGKTAQLIELAQRAASRTQRTELRTGDRGVLHGVDWLVIGVVCQSTRSEGETFRWTEYLLYNVKQGLRWLSSSSEQGWMFSEVMERLPRETKGLYEHAGAQFKRKEGYESLVEDAWGSFNWEVRRGDRADVIEFEVTRPTARIPRGSVLVSETTAHEQTWSLATPLDARAVTAAFGRQLRVGQPAAQEMVSAQAFKQLIGFGCMAHLVLLVTKPTGMGFFFGIVAFSVLVARNWNEE